MPSPILFTIVSTNKICKLKMIKGFCGKYFLFLLLQTAMPGMKRDCGGAAAIIGAFYAAVKQVI